MKKETVYNTLSLVCGVWFLITGTWWPYLAALFIAYPVALAGLYCWYQARQINNSPTNKVALVLLIIGLVVSIGSIFFYK